MERRTAGTAGLAGLAGDSAAAGGSKAGLPGLWEKAKMVGRFGAMGIGSGFGLIGGAGRCKLCGLLPEYMDDGRCRTCLLKPMGGKVNWWSEWGSNSIQSDGLVMRLMDSFVKLFGGVMGFGTACCVSSYNPMGVWYDVKEYWGCRIVGCDFGLSWVEFLVLWGVVCDI
jgi:hypothetical protein